MFSWFELLFSSLQSFFFFSLHPHLSPPCILLGQSSLPIIKSFSFFLFPFPSGFFFICFPSFLPQSLFSPPLFFLVFPLAPLVYSSVLPAPFLSFPEPSPSPLFFPISEKSPSPPSPVLFGSPPPAFGPPPLSSPVNSHSFCADNQSLSTTSLSLERRWSQRLDIASKLSLSLSPLSAAPISNSYTVL